MRMANFLILENKLRAAMKGKELALFYQPQVAIQEKKIVGMEALIRWLPTQGGIISPGEFIPVAEQSGLIIDIGEWVLKESLANLRSIKKEAGLNHLYVSINLSPRQFMDANLVRLVEEALTHTSLDPHELEIEITESTAMKNLEYALKVLQSLKSMGVRIALDDFGVDYSSLSYIHRFPVDTIKIDRAFIVQMLDNSSSAAIVKAIIQIAQALNLKVIAEGVETNEQLDFLKTQTCFGVQGYVFSKPLPIKGLLELLKQWGSVAS
jgi:EAL domain-containing protein (putative c-di-GMP-specific phosphodiesterase class I)